MRINEMLNAAEQLNLLKLIYDNTWRAISQQAGAGLSKPKQADRRHAAGPASAKAGHHKPAKPVMVPVQPMPKPQVQPPSVKTKPKPFNTPTGQAYSSRPAQPQNRIFGSNSQNAISGADSTLVGKMGVVQRNTNTQ